MHDVELDQYRLHISNRPNHLRWWMWHQNCLLLNLAVHKSRVFGQLELLHEPIFGSNFAVVDVFFARIRCFLLSDAVEIDRMIEPLDRRQILNISRVAAMTRPKS